MRMFCVLLYALCAWADDPIAAGAKLFTPTCSNGYCHGARGSGGGGPPLRGRTFAADYLTRVISEGVSGTAMRGFKEDYSKEQIQQLAAYVLSLSGQKPPGGKSGILGDPEAGRAVFFGEKSCSTCHSFQSAGGKSARELFESILLPNEILALTTKDGQRVTGIRRQEDDESIKLLDTSSKPPVSRTYLKADLAKIENLGPSPEHADFASRYTLKQLLDLVSFLKQSRVGFKDLF